MTAPRFGSLVLLLILCAPGKPAVLDRIALVVGNQVFTETEVQEEVRVTELLNGDQLDLSADQRRAAAERLVDQALIRREMETGGYERPKPEEADAMLANFRRERFSTDAEYRAALSNYGVTEQALKQHLLWQLTAMRFTDVRFGSTTGPVDPSSSATTRERASDPNEPAVDQQMESWLKEARNSTKIRFRKEAFQ